MLRLISLDSVALNGHTERRALVFSSGLKNLKTPFRMKVIAHAAATSFTGIWNDTCSRCRFPNTNTV